MFARNVALRLRPNTLNEFTQIFDSQVIPVLRKQPGFKDVITFAMAGGTDVVAISLWETKEHAEAYSTAGYPLVLKSLEPVLDGNPKLRVSDIVNSTSKDPQCRMELLLHGSGSEGHCVRSSCGQEYSKSVEPDFRKRAKAGLQLPRSHENRGEPLSGPALHNGLCTFAAYSARLPAGVN